MELITFRTDKRLVKELNQLQEYEKLDKSSAARKAFEIGIMEWKRQEILKLLEKGKISIGKAATMLGIPYYELLELLKERKINFISMTDEDVERDSLAAKRR